MDAHWDGRTLYVSPSTMDELSRAAVEDMERYRALLLRCGVPYSVIDAARIGRYGIPVRVDHGGAE